MQFNFLGHQNAPKSKIFLALLQQTSVAFGGQIIRLGGGRAE